MGIELLLGMAIVNALLIYKEVTGSRTQESTLDHCEVVLLELFLELVLSKDALPSKPPYSQEE